MRVYPITSTQTIGQRLDRMIARRRKPAKDVWINIYDNSTKYSPEDVGFYINDYEEFKGGDVLNYRLDSETRGDGKLNLGFSHFKEGKK